MNWMKPQHNRTKALFQPSFRLQRAHNASVDASELSALNVLVVQTDNSHSTSLTVHLLQEYWITDATWKGPGWGRRYVIINVRYGFLIADISQGSINLVKGKSHKGDSRISFIQQPIRTLSLGCCEECSFSAAGLFSVEDSKTCVVENAIVFPLPRSHMKTHAVNQAFHVNHWGLHLKWHRGMINMSVWSPSQQWHYIALVSSSLLNS